MIRFIGLTSSITKLHGLIFNEDFNFLVTIKTVNCCVTYHAIIKGIEHMGTCSSRLDHASVQSDMRRTLNFDKSMRPFTAKIAETEILRSD